MLHIFPLLLYQYLFGGLFGTHNVTLLCMRHADLGKVLVTQIAYKLIWRLYIHGIITIYERLAFTVGIFFSLPII